MIYIEIDESKEGVEIQLDSKGVDELIEYLNFIKSNKEHMHLTIGNELSDQTAQNSGILVKHARLVYIDI